MLGALIAGVATPLLRTVTPEVRKQIIAQASVATGIGGALVNLFLAAVPLVPLGAHAVPAICYVNTFSAVRAGVGIARGYVLVATLPKPPGLALAYAEGLGYISGNANRVGTAV